MTALDQLHLIKLSDLCGKKSELHSIDANATVADALQKMKQHNVTCLPVMTSTRQPVGMLDVRSLVFYLAWGKYRVEDLKYAHTPFCDPSVDYGKKPVADLLAMGSSEAGRVWQYAASEPVLNILEPLAKGVHRVLVSLDGRLRLLTQADIARWIASNKAFAPVLDKTVEELGMVRGSVLCATEQDTALEAFRKASLYDVPAIGVTDSNTGRLLGVLSAADLRGMDLTGIRAVEQPVTQFLAATRPESLNPVVVHAGDTLRGALDKMLAVRVHRVFCVDAAYKPVGVISLSDVISKFTVFSPEMHA
jgi:CBS domain-containing protein